MMAIVRGWVKTLMWGVILLACAGVGAFIASRSNPFPPSVGDRSAVPSESPSPSPAAIVRWSLTMSSRTTHTYRVGGSCGSDWRLRGRMRLSESGSVHGLGVARLLPGARCDFPSAQVQARRVTVRILGRRSGDELELRFREIGRQPVGSLDLGSFLATLRAVRFSIPERPGAGATDRTRIEEPDDEIHVTVTRIRLRR
jgi:hypothetical protein